MCQLFWGLFLLFMGASLILNILFGISVPVFKIFLAIMLIYIGIQMLMPSKSSSFCWSWYSNTSPCSFEKCSFDGDTYELRFGKSTVDLNSLKGLIEPKMVSVKAQFSEATIILPAHVPVHVKADLSFGSVHLPGKPLNSEYVNLYGASEPLLTVLIESTFSSVIVQE